MSQVDKILKNIASSEDYKALAASVEKNEYESIGKSFSQVAAQMAESKKQVIEKLQALPRHNRDDEQRNFEAAFARRIDTDLPAWHKINALLKEKGASEGVVYATGKKGDPLVRSADGRLVVVAGSKALPGSKVLYRVETKSEKMDFAREVQLDADYFYMLLNGDTLDAIRKSLDALDARLKAFAEMNGQDSVSELAQLLKELNDVRESAEQLRASEKGKYLSRIQILRRKLLADWVARSIFDFLSREEEKEITQACNQDEHSLSSAMSAPGLFRRKSHEGLKAELFAGKELRGYTDALNEMEKGLDSMNAAIQLMEFKAGIEEMVPLAQRYVERMDILFDNLNRKSRRVALAMSENGSFAEADIDSAIRSEFSGPALCSDLRAAFRSPDDFYAMREAVAKLRSMMGNKECTTVESAIKPYLVVKTTMAFPRR
ncbi:MAG: hypothetical protein Q7T05_05645 [Dehalococcoidia bacterium]|nr:hypothetical protein [Dehalococcoidia bacterium]